MKALLLYVILVGGSLATLIGILRFGRDLTAPPSIAGRWRLEERGARSAPSCLQQLFPGAEPELRVFQSGIYVIVVVHDAVFRGQIQRDRIHVRARRGQGPAASGTVTCAQARKLRLDGVVSGPRDARVLTATVNVPACPPCNGASFSGTRLSSEES